MHAREPTDAGWRPIYPGRSVAPRGQPKISTTWLVLIAIFGAFDVAALLAFIWGLFVGW